MRTAILSDIHGNLTAFEAVVADLRQTTPDLVLHGGDLADGGASPAEVLDRVRELGWHGVGGNTDEILWKPEALTVIAERFPQLPTLFGAVAENAQATREILGPERLAWLSYLPLKYLHDRAALVHASPGNLWCAPTAKAGDEELRAVYGTLGQPIAIYAHIHRSYIRRTTDLIVANTGSVGRSYDGDCRAAYLLLDGTGLTIRRVEYDLGKELRQLARCNLPRADWIASMLATSNFQMPTVRPR